MTRTTDPADPEPSSVSGPSSLQLTPDSDPTSPDPDPEPMDPQPGASNHELPPHTDLVDSQPMNVSRQSSLKLTPDLKQEPVPGPSGLHSELTSLPGPAVGESFVIILSYSYCVCVYSFQFSLILTFLHLLHICIYVPVCLIPYVSACIMWRMKHFSLILLYC